MTEEITEDLEELMSLFEMLGIPSAEVCEEVEDPRYPIERFMSDHVLEQTADWYRAHLPRGFPDALYDILAEDAILKSIDNTEDDDSKPEGDTLQQ